MCVAWVRQEKMEHGPSAFVSTKRFGTSEKNNAADHARNIRKVHRPT